VPLDGPALDTRAAGHDSFLELLRNVSVLRVVFLHMVLRPPLVYLPWIQWVYPGMPEIFFVSGVLMAVSLSRRPSVQVVRDRIRRVILPFAAYAPLAVAAMVITDRRSALPGASVAGRDLLGYVFPFVEPGGSTTRQILWSHLWFVTAFLWVIVLSPLMIRLIDRIGVAVLVIPLGVFAGAIFVRKYLERPVTEQVVNISQFGTFFVLGLLAGRGKLGIFQPGDRRGARWWAAIAVACGLLGTMVALVIEPINNKRPAELYSSRSAYLFIGAAWLALALAFHGPLSAWTAKHRNRFVEACTHRTFTLYLWGLPADAVATTIAKRLLPNKWIAVPTYIGISLVTLAGAVLAFGWIEDWSARRRLRLIPIAQA
jgi:surface polysaccharide O-acyltransferase-like enzyme